MRVVIVGLGLIGGSLALAGRERRTISHLVGVDRPDASARLPSGLCDALVPSVGEAREAAERADLVVLALPVAGIVGALPSLLDVAATMTDVGSTKRRIVAAAQDHPRRACFVPGHPMAGAVRGGFGKARPDLFEGRPWVLCPEGSSPEAHAVVEAFVSGVGGCPLSLTAAAHDRAVAVTSHLPQLLASALRRLAARRGVDAVFGPAFERMTEGAGGPEGVWRDIFASNADEIAPLLRELAVSLSELADELAAEPAELDAALALLAAAREDVE